MSRIDARHVSQAQRFARLEPLVLFAKEFHKGREERRRANRRCRHAIRIALEAEYPTEQIARVFGVAESVVQRIKNEGG